MRWLSLFLTLSCAGGGAGTDPNSVTPEPSSASPSPTPDPAPMPSPASEPRADVVGVSAGGEAGAYTFSVTLRSDDTGCEQYADWWEVVDEDGGLVYRRILGHSHVAEQPFTRSGGPVDVAEDQLVYVRGHMNPQGYTGVVMQGTVASGFSEVEVPGGIPLSWSRRRPSRMAARSEN